MTGAPARFEGGLREVAPGTWAWLQPNGELGESNAGLVVGDGAALLVDALWDRPLTRRMLGAMAPLLADAPLRAAFVTHADGDHWWGACELPAGCELLATAGCIEAMRRESPPRAVAALTRALGLARRLPGRPGAVAGRGHAAFAPFAFGGLKLRHPDRAVADGAELDAGGRLVRVHEVGPAHTANDAFVHVPDAGVVFAADMLFVGVAPIMWHGPVEGWIGALERMLALDASVYVPGHGPPCGRAEVEAVLDYWRWLRAGVVEQRAAGRSPGEAARALLRSPEAARWADWDGRERIRVSVETIYRNLDGRSTELSPPARVRLLLQLAALGAELAAARP